MDELNPSAVTETIKNAAHFDLPSLVAPGCPWTDLRIEYGLPNIDWCEASLCQWVSEPANTWSNLGYLLVAVFFVGWIRRQKIQDPVLRIFPFAAVMVGLTSGIYHASVTYLLQILDFVGMYFFLFLPIGFQAVRFGWISSRRFHLWYGAKILGTTALTWALSSYTAFPIQAIIVFLIVFLFGMELGAYRIESRKGRPYRLQWLGLAFIAISAALACSFIDVSRIHCSPDAHGWFEQGHALWHWLGSIALALSLIHYSQFGKKA